MKNKSPLILVEPQDVDTQINNIRENTPHIRRLSFCALSPTQFKMLAEALGHNTHVYELNVQVYTVYPLSTQAATQFEELHRAINKQLRANKARFCLPSLSVLAAQEVARSARHEGDSPEVPGECREKIKEAAKQLDDPDLSELVERNGHRFL